VQYEVQTYRTSLKAPPDNPISCWFQLICIITSVRLGPRTLRCAIGLAYPNSWAEHAAKKLKASSRAKIAGCIGSHGFAIRSMSL
jgi:hypothetical protein